MLTAEPSPSTALLRRGLESRAAFSDLIDQQRKPLLAYCGRLVGADHAEDVLQQSLLKAWLALDEQRVDVENPCAWLYRIAHNQAMDHLRSSKGSWTELDNEWESPESTERAFEALDRLNRITAGIRDLPVRQRDALLMHSVDGDSYADIATKMETNVPTVSQLIVRARARLREIPAVLPPWLLVRRLTGTKAALVAATLATGAGVPLIAEQVEHGSHAPAPPTASAVSVSPGTPDATAATARHRPHAGRSWPKRARRGAGSGSHPSGGAGAGVGTRPADTGTAGPGAQAPHASEPAKQDTVSTPVAGPSGSGGAPDPPPPHRGGGVVSVHVPVVGTVEAPTQVGGSIRSTLTAPGANVPAAVPAPPRLPLPRHRAAANRKRS